MVVPLIPILLATVLAAGPAALGAIEGLAEAVSNLLKLWSGRHSDRLARRRKPYVVGGYLLSNIVRPLIGLSEHWLTVLGIRVTDRIGKGVRIAPRDALIADACNDQTAGRAYGLTRALDHAGAVLGALTAAAALGIGELRLETVIALSAIPGMLAVALFAVGVKETRRVLPSAPTPELRWRALDPETRRFLIAVTVFVAARIPDSFLLLRGHELGMSPVNLLLLWAALHTAKSVSAEFGGRLTDRFGPRPMIMLSWLIYVACLAGLAFSTSIGSLSAWVMLLALYYGLSEGAERTLVRASTGAHQRGTGFGWYHMLTGLAAIPAGVGLGLMWSGFGAQAAFVVSSAFTLAASFLLSRLRRIANPR